ncbi:MAG: hypothetical protein A2V70_06515 [Planctomycetes bacterium RBG_13_63_9]|nr:MAG: hypothetical protein A2V70_06515 [Planctomycetes bacterium RBG_13_63_9]
MFHSTRHWWIVLLALASVRGTLAADNPPEAAAAKDVDYGPAIARLEQVVQEELQRGILAGAAIALVDDQRIVLAKGFGLADKRRNVPATAQSVYRAGSISKLFTAIAAMQLVEAGKLDIDQPVATYDPELRIVVPFPDAGPITLRQLMCHRSGMIRESPVGSYFDPSEPGIAATVASIVPCALVLPPNTQTKYSNVGPTITGHVVELVAGMPFAEYQRNHVLGPLGMQNSSFLISDRLQTHLAPGNMLLADGHGGFDEIEAPLFELGTLSAGNLFTTAEDLARFLMFLIAEGRVADTQLIKPETLQKMFTPQLVDDDEGYGLGFHVEKFAGHKAVGHMGMVYGHTALAKAIPAHKIGVVVLTNEDVAGGPVQKLGEAALELMLEAKLGQQPKEKPKPIHLEPEELAPFAGDYESQSYWARIDVADGILKAEVSGQRMTFTPVAKDEFLSDGRFTHRASCKFRRDDSLKPAGFSLLEQTFRRVDPEKRADVPDAWTKFLGSYGPEFIPLIVSIKHGHLYAMTENLVDYRLTPMNRTVFKLPPGMYVDEQLIFQVAPDGKVYSVILANMTLPRRPEN